MQVLFVLGPFLVLGLIVIFIAFSGSPGAAREAYLTRGGRLFTFVIVVILYVGLGVAVPAAVIAGRAASRRAASGRCGPSRRARSQEEGKTLFIATCKSCHTLARSRPTGSPDPTWTSLAASTSSAS